MAIIAVAGGSGSGLGRAITLGCAANPNHKVIVITRLASKIPEWLENTNVEVRRVDYNELEGLKTALQGVDTIISTLLAHNPDEWISTQVNLLHAGLAVGVKRFTPSDWGFGPLCPPQVMMLGSQVAVWEELKKAKREHPGEFEWASFHLGGFMNYLGYGSPRTEALNGLSDNSTFIWDVGALKAGIPLNSEGKPPRITLTELGDIGRFVSAAAELEFGSWKEHMGMAGDVLGVDEVVEIIEKVRGKKVEVSYRTMQQIGEAAESVNVEEDPIGKLWLELELAIARDTENEGYFHADLNELFGDKVKPISVKQYIEKWWNGV